MANTSEFLKKMRAEQIAAQQSGAAGKSAVSVREKPAGTGVVKKAALSASGNMGTIQKEKVSAQSGTEGKSGYYSRPEGLDEELNTLQSTLKESQSRLKRANYEAQKLQEQAQRQADKIKVIGGKLRGEHGQEMLAGMVKEYESMAEQYNAAVGTAQEAYEGYQANWARYSSVADKLTQWKGTIRDSQQIQTELEGLREQKRRTQGELAALGSQTQYAAAAPVHDGTEELWGRFNELTEREKLLEEELGWSRYYHYEDMTGAADFGALSQYRKTTENGQGLQTNIWAANPVVETGFDDITYDYINRNENAVAIQDAQGDRDPWGRDSGLEGSMLQAMTDRQIGIYNYVYAKEGREAANEYLAYLRSDLTAQRRQAEEAKIAERAKEHPVEWSALSALAAPLKGVSYLGQMADLAADGRIDQNAAYNRFSYLSGAVRGAVSEKAEQAWGPAGSFLYQTGMSMGDFLINTALVGGNKGLALAIMGTGAAADTTIEAKDRGLDDQQAFTLGTVAGLAEILTEKVSIDALLDKWGMGKGALGYIGKNILAEGGEEASSGLINLFADIIVSKDKSEWNRSIEAYVEQGYSRERAFAKAVGDQALALGLDALGGALSGGVMAAGDVALNGFRSPEADVRGRNREKTSPGGEESLTEPDVKQELPETKEELVALAKRYPPSPENDAMVERMEQAADYEEARQIHDSVYPQGEEQPGRTGMERESRKQKEAPSERAVSFDYNAAYGNTTKDQIVAQMGMRLRTVEEDEIYQRIQNARDDLEATGIYYKVPQDKIDSVRRAMELTGIRKVEFTREASAVNGRYSSRNGTIYINASSAQPELQIYSHEMTHSIEKAGAYNALSDVVLNRIKETGGDLSFLINAKKKAYSGVTTLTDEQAKQEIVAEYVSENLLTNEQEIRELANRDRTLGQRIREWLDRLLAKLKNAKAQERVFLAQARDLYAAALGETSFKTAKNDAIRSAQAQLASGELTEEDYNYVRERIDRQYGEDFESMTVDAMDEFSVSQTLENDLQKVLDGTFRDRNNDVYIGETSNFLTDVIGADTLRVTMPVSKAYSAMVSEAQAKADGRYREGTNYHGLGKEGLVKALVASENPVAAFADTGNEKSKRVGNIVLATEEMGADGNIVVVEALDATGHLKGKRIDANKVITSYDRSALANDILQAASDGRLLHLDKKRSQPILAGASAANSQRAMQGVDFKKNIQNFWANVKWEKSGSGTYFSGAERGGQSAFARAYEEAQRKKAEAGNRTAGDQYSISEAEKRRDRVDLGALSQARVYQAMGLDADEVFRETGIRFDENNEPYVPGNASDAVQYSISETYSDEIDQWDKEGRYPGEAFVLGSTGDVLQGLGAMENDIYLNGDKINKILNDHPEMTIEQIKKIPQILDDPVLILKSKNVGRAGRNNTRMVIYGAVKAQNGNPVLCVLDLRPVENKLVIDGMQKVNSAYTKSGDAVKYVLDSDVLYADKKRTAPLLRTIGFQMPIELQRSGSMGSIRYIGQNVNLEGVPFRNILGTNFLGEKQTASGGEANANGAPASMIDNRYKIGALQSANAKSFGATSETESASTPIDTISQTDRNVNRQYSVGEAKQAQGESRERQEIERDVLAEQSAEVRFNLRRAGKEMIDELARKLQVPNYAKREYLEPMAPELWREFLTNGAVSERGWDSLFQKAFELGNQSDKLESHREFQRVKGAAEEQLRLVRRYLQNEQEAEQRAAQEEGESGGDPGPARKLTPKEAEELLKQTKRARYAAERTEAMEMLTDGDKEKLDQLMRGEIQIHHLMAHKDNVEGIRRAYEARQEYEKLAKQVRRWRKSLKAERRATADRLLKGAEGWKDKANGLLYDRETMERNIRDLVKENPERAQEIIDTYIIPVKKGNAAAKKLKDEMRSRVRALNISNKAQGRNKVSEAYAVQFLGEAWDNVRQLEYTRGKSRYSRVTRDGKTLVEWESAISEFRKENPDLDMERIEYAVKEFQNIYDRLFTMVNEVRIRNGYEPINYRRGYFPHFQSWEATGAVAKIMETLGFRHDVTQLPTTINGRTDAFRPGIRWMANAQSRKGFETTYNALEGFDRYIEVAADVIYLTDSIQNIRALADQVRYRTGDAGLKERADEINRQDVDESVKRAQLEKLYKEGRFELGNFAAALDEYANILAGKKSKGDRRMEQMLGRGSYNFARWVEKRSAANMVAGNISSALTNFIPLTQGAATIKGQYFWRGAYESFTSRWKKDGLRSASTFLTNRQESAPLALSGLDKASEVAGSLMEWIDMKTAETLVRGRYYENLSMGMSEQAAMDEADAYVGGLMGDRSKGAMPALFYQNNPIAKMFTQFQLEVNNQFSFMFKDMPRDFKDKQRKKAALVLLELFLGAYILNDLFEKLTGRRPAFDPLSIVNETVGDLFGYEVPNTFDLVGGAVSGELPGFETEQTSLSEAAGNLANNVLEELPFVSVANVFGIDLDAGRIPVSSSIPDLATLGKAVFGTGTEDSDGWSEEKRIEEAVDELAKIPYYLLMPFGGGQLKKILEGVEAVANQGSYSINAEGEEQLQYPVFYDDPWEMLFNYAKAVTFGKSSLATAQDWVESGFDGLNAKQTAVYQALMEAGTPDRAAFGLLKDLEQVEKTDTESEAMQERRILSESSVSGEGKAIVYYTLLTSSDKERELMDRLEASGANMGKAATVLMAIKDADATLTGAECSNAMREAIAQSGLDEDAMIEIYRDRISSSRDEDIQAFQEAGISFQQFLEAQNAYTTIGEMDGGATVKATELSRWIHNQNFTQAQETTIKDGFKYYNMSPAKATIYERGLDAGLLDQRAYDLAINIDALEPLEGKTNPSDAQKWRAAYSFGTDTTEQMAALEVVMAESHYKKLEISQSYDVDPGAYVRLAEVLPEYDENGNGSYTNAEIQAAIDGMCADGLVLPGGDGTIFFLTEEQKAVLWQLWSTSSSAKNNPYDVDVGWEVIEAKKK